MKKKISKWVMYAKLDLHLDSGSGRKPKAFNVELSMLILTKISKNIGIMFLH